MDRRDFLKSAGLILAGQAAAAAPVAASEKTPLPTNSFGVLVDTTLCIGCRKCELACDRKNKLTGKPDKYFEDASVFKSMRALSTESLTIVNRYPNPANPAKPIFAKTQCMHCVKPSCVSACIVGALKKSPDGAVTYDAGKCIGCRYCMVACPFQIPAYEFENALTPAVKKCTFCFDLTSARDGIPACVEACPVSALTFGRRERLINLGHDWMAKRPGKYTGSIYGEHEAGGTSWMYLAAVPPVKMGLPAVGSEAPAVMSETLQHSVFKHWIPPVSLYLLLGSAMWIFKRRDDNGDEI